MKAIAVAFTLATVITVLPSTSKADCFAAADQAYWDCLSYDDYGDPLTYCQAYSGWVYDVCGYGELDRVYDVLAACFGNESSVSEENFWNYSTPSTGMDLMTPMSIPQEQRAEAEKSSGAWLTLASALS